MTTSNGTGDAAFSDASTLASNSDFRRLTEHALQAVHKAMDQAAAHVVAPQAYPLPDEAGSLEQIFHTRLARLPAETREGFARRAQERLAAPAAERQQRYGAFVDDGAGPRSVVRRALSRPIPAPLAAPARRLREHGSWPDLAQLREGRHASRRERRAPGLKPDTKSDTGPVLAATSATLRVHEVRCESTTEGEWGQDEIRIAGAGYDLYSRSESLSEIVKVRKFKKDERHTFSPPLELVTVPVFGHGVLDVVPFGTIYLAERDAGGFRNAITEIHSLADSELREVVVVAVAALVVVALVVSGGIAGALLGAAAGAASGVGGSIIAASALGVFGALAGAVVGAVALLATVPVFDAVARWLKDDVFPPQDVALHVRANSNPDAAPTRAPVTTSLRGGTYTVTYDWDIRYGYLSDADVEPLRPPTEATNPTRARRNLNKIDHIVVLMLENRSFDQMLGYLSIEGQRNEVEGLRDGLTNALHDCDGHVVEQMRPRPLPDTAFLDDPGHNINRVKRQLWGIPADLPAGESMPEASPRMNGFVDDFKYVLDVHDGIPAERRCDPVPTDRRARIGEILGYHRAHDVPAFDLLATEFAICDHWFSAYPGNTWVNRTIAKTGRAARRADGTLITDNDMPANERAFVRLLDEHDVSWAWYSQDIPSLACIDTGAALGHLGRLRGTQRFLTDVATGSLPSVSWVDPNFVDVGPASDDLALLGQQLGWNDDAWVNFPDTANDDHPPTDITHGQDLVFQIFWALFNSPTWSRTMLVITYDEHGGFHDHVPPPKNPAPEGPAFTWLGARVPTLVVSPHVGRGLVSKRPFDHTSIIKTILTRFDIAVPGDLPRVAAADHLGWLLDAPAPRFPIGDASVRALSHRAALATTGERLRWRAATAPRPTAARCTDRTGWSSG